MDISVVICTYNRSRELRLTLEKFLQLQIPSGVNWEVLVMDNNSKDNTREISAAFQDRLPIRYFFEPQPGKSHALNHSLRVAQGELLIFTDDDVDVEPNWLAGHWEAAQRFPGTASFGGKIVPRWPQTPPVWLQENVSSILRGMAVWYDLGTTEQTVRDRKDFFLGANLSLQKSVLAKNGLTFRPDLGPRPGDPVRAEETFLQQQLVERGFPGRYLPSVIVHHRNPAERMTERYVREWFKGHGMSEVREGKVKSSAHWIFGAPRYLWRYYFTTMFFYAIYRFTRASKIWVGYECEMANVWGHICEFRAQKVRPATTT